MKKEIAKIKYNKFTYTVNHPDNTVLLSNKNVAVIQKFEEKDGIIKMVVKKYKNKESVFAKPCDSGAVNIWKVDKLCDKLITIPLDVIERKCIRFRIQFSEQKCRETLIVGMLH